MKSLSSAALAVTCCLTSLSAQAVLIWDNGSFDRNAPAFSITHWANADDFVLDNVSTLMDVRFWAVGSDNAFDGTFGWAIFSDVAESPGALLDSGFDTGPTIVDTSLDETLSGLSLGIFQIDITLGAVELGPGTYWLGLHDDVWGSAASGHSAFWMSNDTNTTIENHFRLDPNEENPSSWPLAPEAPDRAFQISNSVSLSEPATLALLVIGLLGSLWARSRKAI